MPDPSEFDVSAAHRFFSAHCFNKAWESIDKVERTALETDEMIDAAHASAWHWRERSDRTNENLSISYWQLSRVHALAGNGPLSSRYARLCLDVSRDEGPFLLGYAYEALARAAAVEGDSPAQARHTTQARGLLAQITDPEERRLLEKDLDSLGI